MMSTAYKCNKCGTLYESGYHTVNIKGSVNTKFRPGWYPERIDLCESCSTRITKILREWWHSSEDDE